MTAPVPMMTGDTFGSIVCWKWNRNRYEATLQDGSQLLAKLHREGSGKQTSTYWTAHVLTHLWHDNLGPVPEYRSDYRAYFRTPDEAKRAAFDWYMEHGRELAY